MNLKRFTARTSREALALVRQAFGKDAVVMSTRACPEGVEVLAMAPESLQALEKVSAPAADAVPARRALDDTAPTRRVLDDGAPVRRGAELATDGPVEKDVERLAMSTLSFQDYVRERMLKRRRTELKPGAEGAASVPPLPPSIERTASRLAAMVPPTPRQPTPGTLTRPQPDAQRLTRAAVSAPRAPDLADPMAAAAAAPASQPDPQRDPPVVRSSSLDAEPAHDSQDMLREKQEMMRELRSMRGLIEQRFGALAFIEKMQRQPRQALLTHRLLECGFSPALVRKLVEALPVDIDEVEWAASVLQRNLLTGEAESPIEDVGGVFAMVGPTGVGKTTSTAKLAAAFAARHGAGNLGLITLDAYRVAAHEQLRAYGRILGVPVHTAHDRASLDDLLELLSAKRMVLIDTAGMAQRDARTKELLDMLSHRSVNRLLVVSAASQGETIEDVLTAYRASTCRGVVLSKIDEAMKLGPALDALIRHKVKVLAVANGQRVPEDWHRLSSQALVQRALRGGGSSAWKLDDSDVNLVFTAQPPVGAAVTAGAAF